MLTYFNKFEISATSKDNDTQNLKTGISQVRRKYLKHTFIGIKDRGGYPRLSIAVDKTAIIQDRGGYPRLSIAVDKTAMMYYRK
jgi:hypothetical protein